MATSLLCVNCPISRMVKYVRRHENPDKVILRSENPKYDDMEVNRSEIRDLLVVQNVLHIDNRL